MSASTEFLLQLAAKQNPLTNRETKTSFAKDFGELSRAASPGKQARENSIVLPKKRAWKPAQPAISAKRKIGAMLAGIRPSLWHLGLIVHGAAAILAALYLLGVIAFFTVLLYHTFIH